MYHICSILNACYKYTIKSSLLQLGIFTFIQNVYTFNKFHSNLKSSKTAYLCVDFTRSSSVFYIRNRHTRRVWCSLSSQANEEYLQRKSENILSALNQTTYPTNSNTPLKRTCSSVASVTGTHSNAMCSWTELHPTRKRAIRSPWETVTPSVREYRQHMSASVGYVSAISWNMTCNEWSNGQQSMGTVDHYLCSKTAATCITEESHEKYQLQQQVCGKWDAKHSVTK